MSWLSALSQINQSKTKGIFFALFLLTSVSITRAVSFTDVTVSAGVNYTQWQLPVTDTDAITHMSGGAAAADYDNDGFVDLYVTRIDNSDILYRNLGNGSFQDVSVAAGITESLNSNGATWGDIDNDGDKDLYVTTLLDGSFRNHLYINDGQGAFTEQAVSRDADLTSSGFTHGFSSTFGDYDGDGYLDLYTSEWNVFGAGNSRLLRNQGATNPGHFEDVTIAAGVDVSVDQPNGLSFAFSPTFTDMDRDGHTDLVIASDFGSSRLFWNNGDGTFTNGTVGAGVGTDENGMGSAIGDYDGDGDLDWFVSSIYQEEGACGGGGVPCGWGASGNRLYQNNGDRTFTDTTDSAGVREGGWGWGSAFLDYDNDGDLDLTHTNGADFPFSTAEAPFVNDPTRFWENTNGVFSDVATQVGVTDNDSGKGLVTFDYDNDGDLDLFIVNNASQPILYENIDGNQKDWLRIKTVGTSTNADGIGAQITIIADENYPNESQYWEVNAGSGYLGQSDLIAHFGLGDFTGTIDRVVVEWPVSGITQVIENVAPNALLAIYEPNSSLPGDYNNDGKVDAADYVVWRDHLGEANENAISNLGDGINGVDAADYALWRDNYGMTAGAGGANISSSKAVPEPSSILLLLATLLGRLLTKRDLAVY